MNLITLGPPDQDAVKAASRYVRAIFFCKLLLSALIIPIVIAALFELPHIYDNAESQIQATPILAGLTLGSFYLAIGLFGLKVFAVYFPIFGPVCGAPLHYRLWHSTMFTVGLLLDAIALTPRIFLGSAMDSLSHPQPTTTAHALFSKDANALLLILIAPFAAASFLTWRPFYTGYIAQAREEYRAKHEITAEEHIRWSFFNEEIRHASNVLTLEQASQALRGLRHSVGHLPYKDERHRYRADVCIDTAENHLTACETAGRTDPDYWYTKYRDALLNIPRYGGPIPEIPGPVIDEAALNEIFQHIPPSESLLLPPQVANDAVSNTNSVTPSKVTESPLQTESQGQANRPPPPLESTPSQAKEPTESTPASPFQKPSESAPKRATQSNTKRAERPTTPAATPDDLAADAPPNPFQKGTIWEGMSVQISDGGINSRNDGIQIRTELTVKRQDADQFEALVRCPWVIDAQGKRVRWGATASARGTFRDGKITIRSTPLHVPAGTVLLPGTWTGTVSDDIFSGEVRGNNNSRSEVSLQLRAVPQPRSPAK